MQAAKSELRAKRRALDRPLAILQKEARYEKKKLAAMDYLKRLNREDLILNPEIEANLRSKGDRGFPEIVNKIQQDERLQREEAQKSKVIESSRQSDSHKHRKRDKKAKSKKHKILTPLALKVNSKRINHFEASGILCFLP